MMTPGGDPPAAPGSGRSIYERLGLTSMPGVSLSRPVQMKPTNVARPKLLRYLIGGGVLLVAFVLAGIALSVLGGAGTSRLIHDPSGDDVFRTDRQERKIAQLELRVGALETQVSALQKLSAFQGDSTQRNTSSRTRTDTAGD